MRGLPRYALSIADDAGGRDESVIGLVCLDFCVGETRRETSEYANRAVGGSRAVSVRRQAHAGSNIVAAQKGDCNVDMIDAIGRSGEAHSWGPSAKTYSISLGTPTHGGPGLQSNRASGL